MEYIPIIVTLLPGTTFSVKYLESENWELPQLQRVIMQMETQSANELTTTVMNYSIFIKYT